MIKWAQDQVSQDGVATASSINFSGLVLWQVVPKIRTTEEDYTGPYHNMWNLGLGML